MTNENPAPASLEETSAQLYGIAEEGYSDGSHICIQYCGFKAGRDEVRIPSARTFVIKADQVTKQGPVAGFEVNGRQVLSLDVPLNAEVFETTARKINLGVEIATSSGRTIGGLLSAKSGTRPQMESSDTATAAEQMDRIRAIMQQTISAPLARDEITLEAYCASVQQSYSWTTHTFSGPKPDPWGSDCDN